VSMFSMLVPVRPSRPPTGGRYLGSDFLPRGDLKSVLHFEFGCPPRPASQHCHEEESPLLAHQKRNSHEEWAWLLVFFKRASDCESEASRARSLSSFCTLHCSGRPRPTCGCRQTLSARPCFYLEPQN